MPRARASERHGSELGADPDLRFVLPFVDASPAAEAGMILLGLGAERLLAGLGLAARGEVDDPGQVALAVDLLLHRSSPTEAGSSPTEAGLLVAEGARRWRAARPAVATTVPVGPTTADIRGGFARVHRAVGRTELRNQGIAGLAYLTACWIRRFDVDPPAGIES